MNLLGSIFSAKGLVYSLILCLVSMASLSGCTRVEKKQPDPTLTLPSGDIPKIRGFLDAAGIKGEIVSIADADQEWMVDVGAPPAKPGQRQAPMPPTTYRVNKTTGKVEGSGGQL